MTNTNSSYFSRLKVSIRGLVIIWESRRGPGLDFRAGRKITMTCVYFSRELGYNLGLSMCESMAPATRFSLFLGLYWVCVCILPYFVSIGYNNHLATFHRCKILFCLENHWNHFVCTCSRAQILKEQSYQWRKTTRPPQ